MIPPSLNKNLIKQLFPLISSIIPRQTIKQKILNITDRHITRWAEIAFIVCLILRIAGLVDWSWWLVALPIWGGLLINLAVHGLLHLAFWVYGKTKRRDIAK